MTVITDAQREEFFHGAYRTLFYFARDDNGVPLEQDYDLDSFNSEALDHLKVACNRFIDQHADVLASLIQTESSYSFQGAGSKFVLERNGSPAAIHVTDQSPAIEAYRAACKELGPVEVYVGAFDQLYLSGLDDATPAAPTGRKPKP